MMQTAEAKTDFISAFKGSFSNILRWEQLDELWHRVRESGQDWYVYAVGETPPAQTTSQQQLDTFLTEITRLLREEHQEDYCGIVYVDNREEPGLIKIYDPNNLGVVCGYSSNPPLPGWVLSTIPPVDLQSSLPQTGSRKRWWQAIFKH